MGRRSGSPWSISWPPSRPCAIITCCRACAVICSASSGAPRRGGRSSSAPRRSPATSENDGCRSNAPARQATTRNRFCLATMPRLGPPRAKIVVVTDSFAARFGAVRSRHGPLVLGLDPSGDLLESWGVGDSPDGLDRFVDIVVDAAAGTVGLVKPQSAFFERHGLRGIRIRDRLISTARAACLLVILDVKRGDVGSTHDAYPQPYLRK